MYCSECGVQVHDRAKYCSQDAAARGLAGPRAVPGHRTPPPPASPPPAVSVESPGEDDDDAARVTQAPVAGARMDSARPAESIRVPPLDSPVPLSSLGVGQRHELLSASSMAREPARPDVAETSSRFDGPTLASTALPAEAPEAQLPGLVVRDARWEAHVAAIALWLAGYGVAVPFVPYAVRAASCALRYAEAPTFPQLVDAVALTVGVGCLVIAVGLRSLLSPARWAAIGIFVVGTVLNAGTARQQPVQKRIGSHRWLHAWLCGIPCRPADRAIVHAPVQEPPGARARRWVHGPC